MMRSLLSFLSIESSNWIVFRYCLIVVSDVAWIITCTAFEIRSASAQSPVSMALDFRSLCVAPCFEFRFRGHALPLGSNPPVQFIQYDICKQRRQDSALRSTLVGANLFSVWQNNRRFQHFLNDAQQLLIPYSQCPYLPNQFCMVDVVEESFDIKVNDMVHMLNLYQPHALCYGMFSGSVRA